MNCDYRGSTFGRNFVKCVMNQLCPDWNDSDFNRRMDTNSPFGDDLKDAVQFIVEERHNSYFSQFLLATEGKPLTVDTYTSIMKSKLKEFMSLYPGDPVRHLDFYLYVAVGASYFYEKGQSRVCDVAVDIIAKCIFELKIKGYFNDSTWNEYEEEIEDMITFIENDND